MHSSHHSLCSELPNQLQYVHKLRSQSAQPHRPIHINLHWLSVKKHKHFKIPVIAGNVLRHLLRPYLAGLPHHLLPAPSTDDTDENSSWLSVCESARLNGPVTLPCWKVDQQTGICWFGGGGLHTVIRCSRGEEVMRPNLKLLEQSLPEHISQNRLCVTHITNANTF